LFRPRHSVTLKGGKDYVTGRGHEVPHCRMMSCRLDPSRDPADHEQCAEEGVLLMTPGFATPSPVPPIGGLSGYGHQEANSADPAGSRTPVKSPV
jgi:hypothetical protein